VGRVKKLILTAVLIGALAMLAGVGYIVYTMIFPGGELAKPELVAAWHEWGVVNETVTEIRSTIIIYNPGGYSATIESLDYEIYVNEIKMAVGHLREPASIEPRSNCTVKVSTLIDNTRIPDLWVSYASSGESIHVEVKGEAIVRAFGITFRVPLSYANDYTPEEKLEDLLDVDEPYNVTSPTGQVILTVESVDTSWGSVTNETTEFIHLVTVYNPNPVPVVMNRTEYEAVVNNLTLASGVQPLANLVIGPYETKNITLYTYLNNTLLDDWWVSHLTNDEKSSVVVKVFMVLADGTRLLIYERSFLVETDILEAMTYP